LILEVILEWRRYSQNVHKYMVMTVEKWK